ncbi:hypothetical protein VCS63_23410 [Achromobacter sp. D10]|uniref:hypothetical protein n=1 Tax=Achromobacter sp. D10 TaxID=3110765 RepID=UPI002B4A5ECB|nr:hypothetical protein [Achromobacter sp. D10]MEB3098804.1 hypothetical protein [Achromobacter sp. D10]
MKLKYYAYYFEDLAGRQRIRMSLRQFFTQFCEFEHSEFKKGFSHNEERVFLLPVDGNFFLFVKAKDTEIVKAIDVSAIASKDISERLMENESLGFSSYVFVADSYLAFAATQLAPTVSAFATFVNELLYKIGCRDHKFCVTAFTETVSRDDALRMSFIGATSIRVTRNSGLFEQLGGVFGKDIDDLDALGAFEVTLKPKPRKDIKAVSKAIIGGNVQGIERIAIRARAELNDRLTDFRVDGLGAIHDAVSPRVGQSILESIFELIQANDVVAAKVRVHEQDDEFQARRIDAIAEFDSADHWRAKLGDL